MKKYIFFLLFLPATISISQSYEDSWTGFFSFVSVRDIAYGDDRIFAAAENAVFTYDLLTQQINTITTINGLSGESISQIHYSQNFGALFIGYDNGLIEVVIDGEDDVLKVVDILEKPSIPPDRKRINHFNEYEGKLYIATQYGISVYEIANLEFGDTYYIGDQGGLVDISQTTILEPYIYAGSGQEGVKRALLASDDLINFEEWVSMDVGTGVRGIQTLGDEVFMLRGNNRVIRIEPGPSAVVADFGSNQVKDFTQVDDLLTVTSTVEARVFGPGFVQIAAVNNLPGVNDEFQSGMAVGNFLYLGTPESGMFQIPFGSTNALQILPDGPILNNSFTIDASPGQVWVGFGDITVNFNPFPLSYRGISNFKDDTWTNIDESEIFGASDIVFTKINPLNPNEVFFSSYQQGLLRVVDQSPQILYNETNSALELSPTAGAGIRIYGSAFDRDNNLWFTQTRIEEGLVRLSPSGQFLRIDISDIINPLEELALNELAISREGYIFFGSAQNGLIGFNPSNGNFNKITEGAGNGNLPNPDIRAIAFDSSNRLWIGTREGLRVLFNVAGFFQSGNNTEAQAIIILEDGVPQELLFQQTITDIEVDGSNNKWIATSTSGVFYLSPNGQETLLRFTRDNSPLPSNNVQDIAIDDSTGRVYFATTKGLVAFEGTSTAPRENLENVYAYPNPVRPGFSGNVTIDGLTAGANVKITDIEGNLVFETTSKGGSILWDTTAFGRYKVASGVYLVLITSADALETKVTKIMVVR